MKQLDDWQHQAIRSSAGTTLIVAGPGSGKTTVLTQRIEHMIRDRNIDAAVIAVVTYTNAAAREIAERLQPVTRQRLGYLGTLHGLCLRIIRNNPKLVGFTRRVSVFDENQTKGFLESVRKELGGKPAKVGVKELALTMAGGPFSIPVANRTPAQLLAGTFYSRLKEADVLTFDTILHYTLAALRRKPDAAPFFHLLVDEYQDASLLDDDIYSTMDCLTKYFVGDPDQSIYGFRGANVQAILNRSRQPGIKTMTLDLNYRCWKSICEAANMLIVHNRNRLPKDTTAVGSNGHGIVRFKSFAEDQQEYDWIAGEIAKQEDKTQCAVLVRRRFLVDRIALALGALGIPVLKREMTKLPIDWTTMKRIIGVLVNPENDFLAYWFLTETVGQAKADAIRIEAGTKFTSINAVSLKIPADLDPDQTPAILAKFGIGPESIELLQKAISLLPEGAGMADLLLELSSAADIATETTGTGVFVGTIHGAKGREWDHVFLPAFDEGILPDDKTDTDREEERRLAFVGITRARKTLTVATSAMRVSGAWQRKPEPALPSAFIAEAGGVLIT